jgi:hypothetical protein
VALRQRRHELGIIFVKRNVHVSSIRYSPLTLSFGQVIYILSLCLAVSKTIFPYLLVQYLKTAVTITFSFIGGCGHVNTQVAMARAA